MKSFIVDLADNVRLLEGLIKAYNDNTNDHKVELSKDILEKIVIARIDDHLQWNLVWASKRFYFKETLEKHIPWFRWHKSTRRSNRFYDEVVVPYEDLTTDLGDLIEVGQWDIPYIQKMYADNPVSKVYVIGSYGDYRVAEWERMVGKEQEQQMRKKRATEFDGFTYKALFRMELHEKMKLQPRVKFDFGIPNTRKQPDPETRPSARAEDLSLYEAVKLDTIIRNK